MKKRYEWRVVNQWDSPKPEYHTKIEKVVTGLSNTMVTYLLVECVNTGNGYIQTVPVNKTDVMPEMIQNANENSHHLAATEGVEIERLGKHIRNG